MSDTELEELEYDLEQSQRSHAQWREKVRTSHTEQGQVIARSMEAFYQREVQRLQAQLHAERTR